MNTLVKFLVISLLVFTGLYGSYQARHLILGPEIIWEAPNNGEVVSEGAVTIAGFAHNITKLYLNGRQIFTDTIGHFDEKLLLAYGYNSFELVAIDKFGRTKTTTRSLVFK